MSKVYIPIKYIYHDTYPETYQNHIKNHGFDTYVADDEKYDGVLANHPDLKVVFFSSTYVMIGNVYKFPLTVQYPRKLENGYVSRILVDVNKLNLFDNYSMFQVKEPTKTTQLQVHILFIEKTNPKINEYTTNLGLTRVDQTEYKYLNYDIETNQWKQLWKEDSRYIYINIIIANKIAANLIETSLEDYYFKGDFQHFQKAQIDEAQELARKIEQQYGVPSDLCNSLDDLITEINHLNTKVYEMKLNDDDDSIEQQEIVKKKKNLYKLAQDRERIARINEKYQYE
eukprot:TRINITY_DN15104_c0_g1_i1.p1 TRINITY_DN15104_c0_g1~~TRINITY_DN15104_c0_g1_i1.p1  ORF type:complete len:285 (-),score=33.98 TRINITY_DN15104_c0_g1_i1:35-889(-)